MGDAVLVQGARQHRQMQARHRLVGDDDDLRLLEQRAQTNRGPRQKPAADMDIVAARAQRDSQLFRLGHDALRSGLLRYSVRASYTRSTVTSGGASTLSTVMSARA